MAEKMLKFVKIGQVTPVKRDASERTHDFSEIYKEFARDRSAEQASRCSQCGVPFCQIHCPVHNNIPDWLKLVAEGRLEEAYELSQATNNFPEICGRICPQDRLCEGNCVIEQSGHGTVTIGAVEKFITETAFEQGWVRPRSPRHLLGQSAGIIGAGPAGMTAAEELRALGYEVTVYDRYDRVGGLMVYGIPNFKLEKPVVERRHALLQSAGVRFQMNCEVGREVSFADLRQRHQAVLIATGVYAARELPLPGAGMSNVVQALNYLTASNRKGFGDRVPEFDDGALDAADKHVVVVGGGDTAMDCVRTAVRQGAKSVRCLYRRDRANMPGSMREVKHAEEEGVEFVWLSAPKALHGTAKASAVKVVKMRLGQADASGRQAPQAIDGSEYKLKADLVIKALGFDPENLPAAFDCPELAVTRWGTVKTDFRTLAANLDGVFAAGDIVRGASLVVWAIRDGRDAAAAMHKYLQSHRAAPPVERAGLLAAAG